MSVEIALRFWKYIDSAQFDKLAEVMSSDVAVWCPNTREVYQGAKKFIDFNKAYPGRWFANVEKTYETQSEVVTVAKVFNEDGLDFYSVSFFEFEKDKIKEITQYWGDNSQPPAWRIEKGLSETY